jgi:hypothetical protein
MTMLRTLAAIAAAAAIAGTSHAWSQGSTDPHHPGQPPASAGNPAPPQQGGTPGSMTPGRMGQGGSPGMGQGMMGPGMMGQGMMGPGMMGQGMMGGMPAQGMGMMANCPMMGMAVGGDNAAFPEGRVAFLRAELGITETQKDAWESYAAVLKKNLQNMQAMRQNMMQVMQAKTPVERIDTQIGVMESRLSSLKELKPALTELYSGLTAEQKTKADQLLTGMGCMS